LRLDGIRLSGQIRGLRSQIRRLSESLKLCALKPQLCGGHFAH
jgi:hypothetical protein